MLLKKVTSPVSFEDIRTFNGEDVYFKGLFTNSTAWQTRWGRVLLQGYGGRDLDICYKLSLSDIDSVLPL